MHANGDKKKKRGFAHKIESGTFPAQPEPNTSVPQSPKMIAPRKRRAPGE
jgi:hypothetical protein